MNNEKLCGSVRVVDGRPTLFIGDQPVPPILYSLTSCPGGRWSWEEIPAHSIRLFARSGVHLHQVDLRLCDFWTAPGKITTDVGIRQLQGVLDADPEAAIMIRFHINAPHWWDLAHPEECAAYADTPARWQEIEEGLEEILGDNLQPIRVHSFASQLWLEEASAAYAKSIKRLAESKPGARVFAIQVAGGVYGEFHPFGFLQHDPDVSEPMRRAFSRFLAMRYADSEALSQAWGMPGVALDNPPMPGTLDRERTTCGALRSPEKEQWVIDYYDCLHSLVADDIIHFCALTKRAWRRPVVTAAFYGYFFSLFGRQAAGGHLGIDKVLISREVDCLCAPQSYLRAHRGPGGSGQTRLLMESARLHGKLTLDEMDQPPHTDFAHPVDRDLANHDMRESLAILRRNVLASGARGMGMWFYDFGPYNHAGWWTAPELQTEISRLQALCRDRLSHPLQPAADVLAVFDARAFLYAANNAQDDPVTDPIAVNRLSGALYQSGAAFDGVYLADLSLVDLSRYRCVIFANAYLLTPEQRAFLRDRVAADGRHVVFCFADGAITPQGPEAAAISETAGISVERRDQVDPLHIDLADSLGGGRLSFDQSYWEQYFMFPFLDAGKPKRFSPNFVVSDGGAEIVARYAVTGDPAGAVKRFDTHTAWYFALPPADPAALRAIFARASVHIYCDQNDSLHAGLGMLVLHTASGGLRHIALRSGASVSLRLPPCSTAVLDAETGEKLL